MVPSTKFRVHRSGSDGGAFYVWAQGFSDAAKFAVTAYGWKDGELTIISEGLVQVYRIADGMITLVPEKSQS